MLLRLLLFRLGPLLGLQFCKEKKKIKLVFMMIAIVYSVCFFVAAWTIFNKEQWLGILYLPISMFPHYLCYGFAIWLLLRCLWNAWSERVWKRIYSIALLCVFLGILAENYWNPKILQFFCNFFK